MPRDSEGLIASTPEPRTRPSLAADLAALGVRPGMSLIAHSSLSSLGWVNGGTVAVVQALMDALTPSGTLVMPAHSGGLSEPAYWVAPPIPSSWWDAVRETMPAFDPRVTPCLEVGKVPETFRSFPGVLGAPTHRLLRRLGSTRSG